MEEKLFSANEKIINQGDNGKELFILDFGTADCYKKINEEGEEKLLKTYNPGDVFGELALL